MSHTVAQNAPIDLNLLPLFILVAETSSFARAAERLGVKRSSVSRSVAALEHSLGVQLFSRTTRHVGMTTAGTALYAKLSPQIRALQDALGALSEQEQEPSGLLRLTAPSDIGAVLLPPILAGFSLRYPDVQFELSLTNRIVDLVADGYDAALRVAAVGKLPDSSLIGRKMGLMELRLYASPAYLARSPSLRTATDLNEHHVMRLRGMKLLETLHAQQRFIADDILFLYGAAKAGLGVAMLPTFLVRDDVVQGTLVRVLANVAFPSGTLYFVHPQASHVPRKVSALRDYMGQALDKLIGSTTSPA